MPLHDHFVPPLSRTHPWRGFHSAWAAAIARGLNQGVLPAGYYAIPTTDFEGPVEIDVAALQDREAADGLAAERTGTLWTPAEPALCVTVDFPALELVEVQVFYDEGGPVLVGAIELVSPRNKDRPSRRRAVAIKCVSYLQQGSAVVVVDIVTPRRANFHTEVLRLLELDGTSSGWQSPTDLYVVAYRAASVDDQWQLQAWPFALTLGSGLPRLPLWLGTDVCVPLDLEASYQATCSDLRIRIAG
jgi:hypothetical protein